MNYKNSIVYILQCKQKTRNADNFETKSRAVLYIISRNFCMGVQALDNWIVTEYYFRVCNLLFSQYIAISVTCLVFQYVSNI